MKSYFIKIPLLFFVGSILFLHRMQAEEKNLCLALIIKNDSAVIEQCLYSAREIIDCLCVCDTGSTDNTIQLIRKFMEAERIPVRIYSNKTFDKSYLLEAAQSTIQEFGFSLSSTYILTLDPEMVVHKSSEFKKDILQADSYLLSERSLASCYNQYNIRLLRASLPWKNNGELHEYWSYEGSFPPEKLRSLTLDTTLSDEDKENKLRDRIQQLLQVIEKDPVQQQQYVLQLAHFYKCLKQYDSAIHWYQTRIQRQEDKEEVWHAKCMLGECYEEMKQWEQALSSYLEAFQYNPDRTEPLQKIATHYRLNSQPDLAYIFAKHGSRIPFFANSFLLVDSPFQDYQFDEELSIVAYYTRFREEGFIASNSLILKKGIPYYLKAQTYRNILFYTDNLKNARFQPILINLPTIQDGFEEHYHPMNPSIQKGEVGYEVICRTVNYTQTGAKIFTTSDPSGVFRTKNFLVQYDRNFNVLSQKEIIENLPRIRTHAFNIDGLEDCRLFAVDQGFWFTCNTSDTNPYNHQISLCKLTDKISDNTIEVEKLVPLKGPDPYRCEKNWLPFIKDGDLYLIYSYDPFIIYKPNRETGDCQTVLHYEPSQDFSSFRGSAAPIEFDDGYLMMVHEVVFQPTYERVYLHRFLYLDKQFMVKKLSQPFTFLHQGVEYCCGMTTDHAGKELILSIGIEDREAYLCFINFDAVRSILKPVFQN